MILTDREIQIALDERQIVLDPRPQAEAVSSTSIDLSLSPEVRIWKKTKVGADLMLHPAAEGYDFNTVAEKYADKDRIGDGGFDVRPGDFFLAWTNEELRIPATSRLAARVEGKSSLARIGLGIHITAPTIHAGFEGKIQLEMFHSGVLPIRLQSGMPICQLIFEQTLGTPNKGYRGQFQNQ